MKTLEEIKQYILNTGVLWHLTTEANSRKIINSGMNLSPASRNRVYFYVDPSVTPSDYDLCRSYVNADYVYVYMQNLDMWCAPVTQEMLDNMHLDMALNEFHPGAAVYIEGINIQATLHTPSARKRGVACTEYRNK